VPENESNPTEPTGNPDPNPVDEAEIDRILAEAAGLTEQLQDEVGLESTAGGGVDVLQEQPGATDVDSQVNRVEELLRGVVSVEESEPVDPTPEQADDPAPPDEAADAVDTAVESTPDVEMPADADETASNLPDLEPEAQPAEPATEVADQTEEQSTNKPDDDSVPVPDSPVLLQSESEFEQASASQPDDGALNPTDDAKPQATVDPASSQSSAEEPGTAGDAPPMRDVQGTDGSSVATTWPNAFAEYMRTLRAGASQVLEGVLHAFDIVDTRCAWISYKVRRIIGWIAVAVLVAAATITAYSLL